MIIAVLDGMSEQGLHQPATRKERGLSAAPQHDSLVVGNPISQVLNEEVRSGQGSYEIGQWGVGGLADDERCRVIARLLDRNHPAWTVWWGPKTRRYWALPARGLTAPVLERARPEDLEAAMREAETWYSVEGMHS